MGADHVHRDQRQAFADRVSLGGNKRLDRMCECVHAGRGCQTRRERAGHLGVQHRQLGRKERTGEGHLHVRFLVAYDGEGRYLAAGAGGGWDGDHRDERSFEQIVALVVVQTAALSQDDANGFGCVERRAAADRHEQVGTPLAGVGGTALDDGD